MTSSTATVIEGTFLEYSDGFVWIKDGAYTDRFAHDRVLPLYELEEKKGRFCKLMIPVAGPAKYSRLSFPKR
jgi:hypothetical protein